MKNHKPSENIKELKERMIMDKPAKLGKDTKFILGKDVNIAPDIAKLMSKKMKKAAIENEAPRFLKTFKEHTGVNLDKGGLIAQIRSWGTGDAEAKVNEAIRLGLIEKIDGTDEYKAR